MVNRLCSCGPAKRGSKGGTSLSKTWIEIKESSECSTGFSSHLYETRVYSKPSLWNKTCASSLCSLFCIIFWQVEPLDSSPRKRRKGSSKQALNETGFCEGRKKERSNMRGLNDMLEGSRRIWSVEVSGATKRADWSTWGMRMQEYAIWTSRVRWQGPRPGMIQRSVFWPEKDFSSKKLSKSQPDQSQETPKPYQVICEDWRDQNATRGLGTLSFHQARAARYSSVRWRSKLSEMLTVC